MARFGRLAGKELREILRDRRTIITLILMPLLLYPLLGVAFRIFFLSHVAAGLSLEYRVVCLDEDSAQLLAHYVALAEPPKEADNGITPTIGRSLQFLVADSPEEQEAALRDHRADVGVRFDKSKTVAISPNKDLAVNGEWLYRESSIIGKDAVRYLKELILSANARFLAGRLQRQEVSQRAVPFHMEEKPIAEAKGHEAMAVVALVPLVLILMTITGAVYPAIDLTAGERERGTLELLVAAPMSRLQLLLAKYVAVVTVAILTALVNLIMMTLTAKLSGLTPVLFGARGLPLSLIVQVFALLLLFVLFFGAVLLALTSFARSFKEAQAYLVPLMLLSLAPGIIGVVPGLTLFGPLAVVPLLNIVLAGRDLLLGQLHPVGAIVVIGSTLTYAFVALALASLVFGAEAVLFRERGMWFRRK